VFGKALQSLEIISQALNLTFEISSF